MALFDRLSNVDGKDLHNLMKDCAIFSELAYQEDDYVQNCWQGNPQNPLNQGIDSLTALLRAEIIVPPGPREYKRHHNLLKRCTAFRPKHCGGRPCGRDSVMYIFPFQFPSSSPNQKGLDIIILAFRGTNSFQSLAVTDVGLPVLTDLSWPQIDGDLADVKVDLGFELYLRSLLTDLDNVGEGTTVLLDVQCSKSELILKPIICTGHSLGGAASTLAALYLSRKCSNREVGFINMGSPRVGNHHFARLVGNKLEIKWRVVNGCDPVVALPPNLPLQLDCVGIEGWLNWIRNFYYEHVGQQYQIGFEGGLSAVPLLDHCIAMYIYQLTDPNSQNSNYRELGVDNLQSWFTNHLTNPIQLAARHVGLPEQRQLTRSCVTALRDSIPGRAAAEATNVATVINADGHRALHFLTEWTHRL